MSALRTRYAPVIEQLRGSETAKAVGLAGAMIVNNIIALGSTVVFARLLSDYGSLAALVSYFLILSVVGQAMQVATAREGVLGHFGVGAELTRTLKSWTRSLAWMTLVVTIISILLRQPIASAVGVKHDPWAAAIGLPAGMLWLELSILRGALQGVGDYRSVGLSLIGEQSIRLISGALLAIPFGVSGAYLGSPISFIVMCAYCAVNLRRYLHRQETQALPVIEVPPSDRVTSLWQHVRRAWAPIAGLIVIAVLQNIDIIAAKHRFEGVKNLASSYAATAVAAKVLIWVAIGAGFYLVPEVSRKRAAGEDTRPVLAGAVGIIVVCSIPVLLIFGFGAHPLLKAAFGAKRLQAESSLFVLGVAFTMLAGTYLAIQYMLALKRFWFLIAVGAVAIAEPVLLLQAPQRPKGFAVVVLAVQAVGAVIAFAIALRRAPAATGRGGPPVAAEAPPPAPEPASTV